MKIWLVFKPIENENGETFIGAFSSHARALIGCMTYNDTDGHIKYTTPPDDDNTEFNQIRQYDKKGYHNFSKGAFKIIARNFSDGAEFRCSKKEAMQFNEGELYDGDISDFEANN